MRISAHMWTFYEHMNAWYGTLYCFRRVYDIRMTMMRCRRRVIDALACVERQRRMETTDI